MRILSIDGGGIRGIIPALLLAELEARAGTPIAELFDLIAGTSTGGILACALTRPGARSAADLVGLYRDEGPSIFRRSLLHEVSSVNGFLGPKYEASGLEAALAKELGDARLAQATTQLLVTSYDLEAREPYFFKSWRPERDAPMTAVARATAAAPTYFAPLKLGARALVDGGVFATNPAMCAYAESRRLLGRDPDVLLALGTGQQIKPIPYAKAKGWGELGWVRPVIDVVFDGVADTVDYELLQLLPEGVYTRLQTQLTHAADGLDDASPANIHQLELTAQELIAARSADLDAVVARLSA